MYFSLIPLRFRIRRDYPIIAGYLCRETSTSVSTGSTLPHIPPLTGSGYLFAGSRPAPSTAMPENPSRGILALA